MDGVCHRFIFKNGEAGVGSIYDGAPRVSRRETYPCLSRTTQIRSPLAAIYFQQISSGSACESSFSVGRYVFLLRNRKPERRKPMESAALASIGVETGMSEPAPNATSTYELKFIAFLSLSRPKSPLAVSLRVFHSFSKIDLRPTKAGEQPFHLFLPFSFFISAQVNHRCAGIVCEPFRDLF